MIQRRDLIKFAAGGVAGTALTPIPWKLMDDTSIWSQNWSWIPKVPRGEIKVKASACTLCPAGCAVQAHCVGDRAVGLEGALCPVGYGGHAAAYHPSRAALLSRDRRGAISAIKAAIHAGGSIAILDLGPRRTLSALYAEAAKTIPNGRYLRMPDRDESTLNSLAAALGREPGTLGIDLDRTRTIVSFGAPILDGWAVPGAVMNRWRKGDLKIVQIEPRQSRTALAAQTWIPVEPGSEARFINTSDFAQRIAVEAPAVFIAGGDAASGTFDPTELDAIARLNLNQETGIVARNREPWQRAVAEDLIAVPDKSLSLLFIDCSRAFESTPWPLIERKLASKAVVVAFAYKEDECTAHADFVLPVRAPYEALDDIETPPCSPVASFALAPPVIGTPGISETPVDYLNAFLKTGYSLDQAQKDRVTAIHTSKRGHTGEPVTQIATADDLYNQLLEGAVWQDDPSTARVQGTVQPARYFSPAKPRTAVTLVVYGTKASGASPLETKLDQESALYAPAALARIHPETAGSLNLKTGDKAMLETPHGSTPRSILMDPAVMPGVVEVSTGPGAPDITAICTDGSTCNWRAVPVNVRKS